MDSDKWMMVTMGPQTVKWHLSFDTLLGVFYTPSVRWGRGGETVGVVSDFSFSFGLYNN